MPILLRCCLCLSLAVSSLLRSSYGEQSNDPIADRFDYPFGEEVNGRRNGTPRCPGDNQCQSRWGLSQGFGDSVGGGEVHLGEDWNFGFGTADEFKPIYAAADGVVTHASGSSNAWLGVVIIRHTASDMRTPTGTSVSQVRTQYGHLDRSSIQVSVGNTVCRGDLLGYIAAELCTACTGPHLHFEIRTDPTILAGYGNLPSTTGYVCPSEFIEMNRNPRADKFRVGDRVEVFGTGVGLRSRVNHCSGSNSTKPDGTRGQIIAGPVPCEGYMRWRINWDNDAVDRWSAEDWLRRISGGQNPVEDDDAPSIFNFEVTPETISEGDSVNIFFALTDGAGSGLDRVDVRRAPDSGGQPGSWSTVETIQLSNFDDLWPIEGGVAGETQDEPPSAGTFWYGLRVYDQEGNRTDPDDSAIRVIVEGEFDAEIRMVSVSDSTLEAGDQFTIEYEIESGAAGQVLLGACLEPVRGGALEIDQQNDRIVTITGGRVERTRDFDLPDDIETGSYDLYASIWMDTNGNSQVDFFCDTLLDEIELESAISVISGDVGGQNRELTPAALTAPQPFSQFLSATVMFIWDAGRDVAEYALSIGDRPCEWNIYNASQGTNRNATVVGLPDNGSTVYVRIWSRIAGDWYFRDYTYTAHQTALPCFATLVSPRSEESVGFPLDFSWTLMGECDSLRHLIAVNPTPAQGEFVASQPFEGNSKTVSAQEWANITNLLGETEVYFWTLDEASGGEPGPLAPWRPFVLAPCRATLTEPSESAQVAFPNTFRWELNGNCPPVRLIFARSPNPAPGHVAFGAPITETSRAITADQWRNVVNSLGVSDTYYWTLDEFDGGRPGPLAAWRPFSVVPCRAVLEAPNATEVISIPETFSWSLVGSCPSVRLIFASNPNPTTVAFGMPLDSNSSTIIEDQWKRISDSLGRHDVYYWTIDEAFGGTPGEPLAPWRPIRADAFENWAQNFVQPLGLTLDDDDRDGIINLLELAFGGDPHIASSTASGSPLLPTASVELVDGSPQLRFKYRRRVGYGAIGLQYEVEVTNDLARGTWRPASIIGEEVVAPTGDGGITEFVTVGIGSGAGDPERIFARLNVYLTRE